MENGAPESTDDARHALVEALVATGEQDRAAFVRVYRLTAAKLFGICLRICGDRTAAEDVLQDVYVSVWKRASGFEPGRASPITWLATIARNRAIDWRRANPVRDTTGVDDIASLPEPSPSACDQMLVEESDRRLHLCLDQLQDSQRQAIRAAFFGGLTYAELADRGAVPLGTVKSWIRRGLGRLRDCLDDDA
ncbi:sigma-70 family RNA polymerase sigma factor [Sphingomonas sp. XXL09]|uniref:sigma-70 family RNA polymerase sigma factor n=1 Tax=Sphingomonas sp. XXL09 TaxID=3457787 RepID=UPI00406BB01C